MKNCIYALIVICFVMFLPYNAYANTLLPSEDMLEPYGIVLEDDQLVSSEYHDVNITTAAAIENDFIYSGSDHEIIVNEPEEKLDKNENIDEIGSLLLSQGFEKIESSTFSKTKKITGEGQEDSKILVMVYYGEEESKICTYENQVTIGPSGIFNEELEFEHIGENYILIAVEEDGDLVYKIFQINYKGVRAKEVLQKINIDLTNPDIQDDMSTSDKNLEDGVLKFKLFDIKTINTINENN